MATRHEKVQIVGIGDDGVDGMTAQARRLLEAAEVLLGPESCAALLPPALAGRLEVSTGLDDLVERRVGVEMVLEPGEGEFHKASDL